MNKVFWITGIIIFVFVTAFVLSLDNTSTRHVRFKNQNFEIQHENTALVNDDRTKINLSKSNIENKELNAENQNTGLNSTDVNLNNSGNINSQNISVNNDYNYTGQNTAVNNQGGVSGQKISYKNLDDSNLDNILKNADSNVNNRTAVKYEPLKMREPDKYVYRDIDWNTWRSNFVNQILDDSINIHELDQYGEGTWFMYSFVVHKNGAISDISVKSMYLNNYDKQLVANLIKSYQYKSITIFPHGSTRQSAKVTAVMMLSNTSSYSKPGDFNDGERVKIKL